MHTSFSWRDSRFCIWSCTQKETKIIVKGEKKKICSLSHSWPFAGWNKHHCGIVTEIDGKLQKLLEGVLPTPRCYVTIQLAWWLKHTETYKGRACRTAVWLQIVNRPLSHSDRPSVGTVFVLPLLGYCRYTVMQHHGLDQRGASIHLNKSRYQTQSWILFSPMGIACLDHTPKKAF